MDQSFQSNVLERLTRIETKLSNGIIKKQDDHEKRIRILERGLFVAIGIVVVLQIALKFFIK